MNRGMLNERVQSLSRAFFKRDLSVRELRLYPYIDYCCKNDGEFETRKVTRDELKIIQDLEAAGHIKRKENELGTVCIFVSEAFYLFMQRVLFAAYVEPLEGGQALADAYREGNAALAAAGAAQPASAPRRNVSG